MTGWARRALKRVRNAGLIAAGGGVLALVVVARRPPQLPDAFILQLDLEHHGLEEHVGPDGLATLLQRGGGGPLQLSTVAESVQAAGGDERVKGLVALVGAQPMGIAQLQELRGAVAAFRERAAGRAAAVAYSDAFGEGGSSGTGTFYLASAFDHVFMQPAGLLSVTGLAADQLFARGLLDRWRITPIFFAREEYKSAASYLVNTKAPRAEREALRSMLGSLSGQVVAGIAEGRGLTEAQVVRCIDTAPHQAGEAAALGLIDAPLFRDQALKLAVRLHEAAAAHKAAEAAAKAAAMQAGIKGSSVALTPEAPGQTLKRLLSNPDAPPARPLKFVSVQRYAAALEAQRRRREAARRRELALGRLRELAQQRVAAAVRVGDSLLALLKAQPAQPTDLDAALSKLGAQPATASTPAQLAPATGMFEQPAVAVLTLCGPILLGPSPSGPFSGGPSQQIASLPVIKALRAARRDAAVKAVVLRIDSPGGSAAASEAIHREVSLLRQAGKTVVASMGNAAASGGYYIACAAHKVVAQPGTITGSIGVLTGKLVFDAALREHGINSDVVQVGRNAAMMSPLTRLDRQQRRKVEGLMDATYTLFKQRVAEGRSLAPQAVAKAAKGRVWTGQQALELGLVDGLGGMRDALELAKKEAGLPLQEGAVVEKQLYPRRRSPLAQALRMARGGGEEEQEGAARAAPPGAAPAAWAAALAATAAGQRLSAAELALLQQQLVQSGSMVPQCLSLEAERLAACL